MYLWCITRWCIITATMHANHEVPHACHGWNTNTVTRPYVSSHDCVSVSEGVYKCICICLHTTLCVRVCSWKSEGLGRAWMKYGSHLASCPLGPSTTTAAATDGPLPLSFPRAIWSDQGGGLSWAEGWGVKFVLAGSITMLSNYSTMEGGRWGCWECWVRVFGHVCER